ncbi:type I restriction-modification system subunit M [Massiliimalia timonensis]|nr:type I restriction-modification system subunit M [Massiliimalia timonensis]
MMDTRKEQERAELHRTIWNIANDLRGSVDGWDFKQYVLGMLFYRYISENLAGYINRGEWEAGNTGFDYTALSDAKAEEARAGLVEEKGFFILPSELFCNVLKNAPQNENLNETMETVFQSIEASARGSASEEDFKGLFDDIDVNSNKLGGTVAKRNEQLIKLMNGVAEMKLGNYQDNTIDAFGDAYEYLMGMYASNAGKSGGEYFTPQEVSELLTKIAVYGKTEVNKVYDPACGSGSLLLKAAKVLGKENVRQGFFGQEINITTYNLCRINMFLHDIDYDKFDIAHGDTLTEPAHWDDEPFEAIVSNPPYSIKWDGDSNPLMINDPRFSPAGVLAPKSKADLAFIMHSLAWLATSGTAAIVCFPGVMYRGGAEQKIRKYLIDNNFIDCVIQLPDNLFFGTSIATCIMVLKKSKTDNDTLFIDASKECVKVTNSNKLTPENIDAIVEAFAKRENRQYFTRLVPYDEIAGQGYNLSVSTYVEQEDTREKIDIVKLNAEIAEIVAKEQVLRAEIDKIIAEIEVSV